ncbi:aldo/keto reductase [Clostridium lacusfryxellense]|uniref:aldo/keto reductase n=1 Tax=Clostridium lacusfryxellense TaxID=205328 RepID=UPI001C0DF50A|nr:aldo/keto reductase [Clostridium lacusfryxellense]MBU3113846.1 aldo/keto reductase [Clostridium lacusfryxellense]
MKYREFGKCDFKVSTLGFGCMRLPIINNDDKQIDEEKAIALIRYAIDNGVTYIDTAYPYHKGSSEILVGKALKDGYREKVKLATKLPTWLTHTYEDFDKYLDEQLGKLQTDHIDMYLLHALDKERWDNLLKLDIFKFVKSALCDGRIKQIGFSFHDKLDTFKEIIDGYDWDFCQIQYNFLDNNYQAGTEGLEYAAKKGMGIVIMEPLKGGRLAKNPPISVKEEWAKSEVKKTPAQWALRWVLNHPEVSTILSGMNSMEQVIENMQTADVALPNSLSVKDLELIDNVKGQYNELIKVQCTACNYCMPCPAGVDIPKNFALLNDASMYDEYEDQSKTYNNDLTLKQRAVSCVECGKCEKLCPQHLEIRKHLKEVNLAMKNA